jgi:DNA-binding transcriptional LysR family regulator
MINQAWLKTFCTLVEIGHFTRTAERLFMTQSGVSQHIKKLEIQLDSQLLIRKGKSFLLTSKGHQLHQEGQHILRSTESLAALIKQDNAYVGNIKIASPGSIGLSLYPHLLNLQQKHPALSIDYMFAPSQTIERMLINGEIDVGLLTELSNTPTIQSEKVAEEPLVLVTSNKIKTIDWHTLHTIGFISHPDAPHHGRRLLSENFRQFEHIEQFKHKGFSNQISLILEPVSRGFGFTVLPLNAAKAYHSQISITIHKLAKPVSENLYLCESQYSVPSNRLKLIKSVIVDYLLASSQSRNLPSSVAVKIGYENQ